MLILVSYSVHDRECIRPSPATASPLVIQDKGGEKYASIAEKDIQSIGDSRMRYPLGQFSEITLKMHLDAREDSTVQYPTCLKCSLVFQEMLLISCYERILHR